MRRQGFPKAVFERLAALGDAVFEDKASWQAALERLGVTKARHIKIATEAALLGSIYEEVTVNPNLIIVSDDAGQFDVLDHALCWIHAERPLRKLVGLTDDQRRVIDETRSEVWDFYQQLKDYKLVPDSEKKAELEAHFDKLFTRHTCCASLNVVLKGIYKNKRELLRVLDRPDIPLHNNTSENDIREQVKMRKISGSTRSDLGRVCRDTFLSLKKTCRKWELSFREYLHDRILGKGSIPWLPDLIMGRTLESPG